MRLLSSRLHILLAFAIACAFALTVALSLPAGASAAKPSKIEPRLAKLVEKKDKNAAVEIILRGPDTSKLFTKYAKGGTYMPLVDAVATEVKVKDLEKLAGDPAVSYVLADAPVRPLGAVDYSQIVTTYPYANKAPRAWDYGLDGRGVGIAVIDSGVAPVADFGGRLVQVTGPNQMWSNDDLVGHGSFVSAIIGGRSVDGKFIGIAPGASIYALNVANPAGVNSSDVISALQWVYENAHTYNIRVVNLSLGESLPGSYQQSLLDLAVERVWAAGIVVVVSSGNGGPGAIDFAPANDPLAVTVGATDHRGTKANVDDILASFSAYGTTVNGYSKPELLAPGRLIGSLTPLGSVLEQTAPLANRIAPGYAKMSGTSFAAPQVAGAAALLLQRNPDWSPDQVKGILVRKGIAISGTATPALSLSFVDGYVGTPEPANQGVAALVCAPGSTCLADNGTSTVASYWNSATWNSATWNSATWNSATWNSATWNSATWNSATWNSATWNSATWNSATWNSATWNSATWNSATWNSASWDDPSDVEPVEPVEPPAVG
jgi:serine protease AprX